MPELPGRYAYSGSANAAEGWKIERLTPASRLHGANGLRTGPDGRIYVAQVSGSQVSAINPETGVIETISAMGGDIVAPDDLAFDSSGNMYATEITEGRVSVRETNGRTRVLQGDLPCANPITVYKDRLFTGECRMGGRIVELDLRGGPPRVLLENVPMPNAMEVGPDGMLYFPVMGANEIWRISLDGGSSEVVAKDLGVPDSVKFDDEGFIVSTQVASGQVLRIDPHTGEKTVLAELAPGLDNLTFVGKRLFVSNICGQITEILAPGKTRSLIADGLQWPLGLAVADDGTIFVADGGFAFTLRPGSGLQLAGFFFSPGFPGYTRGVTAAGAGEWVVTTGTGAVARFWPAKQESEILAEGFDRLMGVALTAGGTPIFAEFGTGRVLTVESSGVKTLASDLHEPMGVAIDEAGMCYVAESAAGRVVKVTGGKTEIVVDDLKTPQGLVVHDGKLFIVDVGSKELVEYNLAGGDRRSIAFDLPVGAPSGVVPKPLKSIGEMAGPMIMFSDITAGPDGTLYISGDAEGSVIALQPVTD